MTLQQLIKQYRQDWTSRQRWQDPVSLGDSLDFILTEIKELEQVMDEGIAANNYEQWCEEAFDVAMMAYISADLAGLELPDLDNRHLIPVISTYSIPEQMLTHCIQAVDIRLRLSNGYYRNNSRPVSLEQLQGHLYRLTLLAASVTEMFGFSLGCVGKKKLEKMDGKRQ